MTVQSSWGVVQTAVVQTSQVVQLGVVQLSLQSIQRQSKCEQSIRVQSKQGWTLFCNSSNTNVIMSAFKGMLQPSSREAKTMFEINSAQVFINITSLLQCKKSLYIPLSAGISCMMAQREVRHSGRAHQLHLNRHLPLAVSASSQRL